MGKTCLKCNYIRQDSDIAPDYECPKCGTIYAKFEAALSRKECLRCGYVRTDKDDTPITQCPKCKSVYADYEKFLNKSSKPIRDHTKQSNIANSHDTITYVKTFEIYKHPIHGFEAVKIGFSWPAFFFGFIWMLVCKLWGKAGLWFVFYIIAGIFEATADTATHEGLQAIVYLLLTVVYFALALVPAFKGNVWRATNLKRRGFDLVNTLQAQTKDAAIALANK